VRRAAAALVLAALWGRAQPPARPAAVDLAVLEEERDALRARLAALREKDERLREAPAADVVIGMPVAFAGGLVRHVTAGYLDQVEISLRDISLHKEAEVETRAGLLGRVRPGRYTLDVKLHEVRALLRPGEPALAVKGQGVTLDLPVTLAEGQGRATVEFAWDSRGLGKLLCEDFKVSQAVVGRVVPARYRARGSFAFALEDDALVAVPRFPDLRVNVHVEPSEATWQGLDRAIEERSWRCEAALRKVKVARLVQGVLAKGFDVTVPRSVFRPVRLPAGVQQSLSLEGRHYALRARARDLRITARDVWYGADVGSKVTDAPGGGSGHTQVGNQVHQRTPPSRP
jgi:hypothetical protein